MKILAFDTSSQACSVALKCGDHVQAIHEIAPMQQAKLLLPMIKKLLGDNFIRFNQLDAVAYGCGPGSFTGNRIASSVTQAIGLATQLPIIAISSMAAIAQTALMLYQWERLLVAVDAHHGGQIYWAQYKTNQQPWVELLGQEEISVPAAISVASEGEHWYGVGSGWEKYKEILINKSNINESNINHLIMPTAEAMIPLAELKLHKGEWIKGEDALPCYLR